MPSIENVSYRKLYAFTTGLFLQLSCCGTGVFLIFLYSFIGYLSLLILPRHLQHYFTIAMTIIGLTSIHYYYELLDDSDYVFGIREVVMNQFAKQMSFALSYKDGGSDKITPREKEFAIRERPPLVNYMLYQYQVGQATGGPFTEYKRFENWMERKGDFATILPG